MEFGKMDFDSYDEFKKFMDGDGFEDKLRAEFKKASAGRQLVNLLEILHTNALKQFKEVNCMSNMSIAIGAAQKDAGIPRKCQIQIHLVTDPNLFIKEKEIKGYEAAQFGRN